MFPTRNWMFPVRGHRSLNLMFQAWMRQSRNPSLLTASYRIPWSQAVRLLMNFLNRTPYRDYFLNPDCRRLFPVHDPLNLSPNLMCPAMFPA